MPRSMCVCGVLTETKVAGRKTVVRMAIIFMDELSRLLAAASSFESAAMLMFRLLSRSEMS